ncbi:MAG TPA: hypothetical protein VIL85_07340 [Thermomicrobiales bacterium]
MSDPTSEYRDDRPQGPTGFCHEAGCDRPGLPCYLPDLDGTKDWAEPDAYYCQGHIAATGFCAGCGNFHGGEESFDLDPHNLCDTCRDDPDLSDGDDTGIDDESAWCVIDDAPAWPI